MYQHPLVTSMMSASGLIGGYDLAPRRICDRGSRTSMTFVTSKDLWGSGAPTENHTWGVLITSLLHRSTLWRKRIEWFALGVAHFLFPKIRLNFGWLLMAPAPLWLIGQLGRLFTLLTIRILPHCFRHFHSHLSEDAVLWLCKL